MDKTHTWDLVNLPPGKIAVSCRWIYNIKTNSDDTMKSYKARLVPRDFTQEYGIDDEETFAPIARITSVRSLLAVAATRHWDLWQVDVKNAFLNGDLLEEVNTPPEYSHSPQQVCKLNKANLIKLYMDSNRLPELGLQNSALLSASWLHFQFLWFCSLYSKI